jgi:hypothetical protein
LVDEFQDNAVCGDLAPWFRRGPTASFRGSQQQHTSEQFHQQLLKEHGVTSSMSRSGDLLGQRGNRELLLES